MIWKRATLESIAVDRATRRADLGPVDRAALAFARWQGMTDENSVDTSGAEAELEAALLDLDDRGPEAWTDLVRLAEALGDPVVIGLMYHSLRRSVEQVQQHAADKDVQQPEVTTPARTKTKKPSKDKKI